MKKIVAFITFFSAGFSGAVVAQCNSTSGTYDLVVTGNVALSPSGPQFMNGYVCTGAALLDSTTCCTRFIHVEQGGIYEAGPLAYGFVYLKNGATFDAHGNNNFFGVAYESGAVILNYSGPQTLCTAVNFPSANCATGMSENQSGEVLQVYPNPSSGIISLQFAKVPQYPLAIYNYIGSIIYKEIIKTETATLDLRGIESGIYFIKVGALVKKLAIQ